MPQKKRKKIIRRRRPARRAVVRPKKKAARRPARRAVVRPKKKAARRPAPRPKKKVVPRRRPATREEEEDFTPPRRTSKIPLAPLRTKWGVLAQQEERRRRIKVWRAAIKNFRIKAGDAGRVVFISAHALRRRVGHRTTVTPAGRRVGRRSARKVFAVYVTKPTSAHPRGRALPYYDWREQSLKNKFPPKATKISSMDLGVFRVKKIVREFYGDAVDVAAPVVIARGRGERQIDFMDKVVPRLAAHLKRVADKFRSQKNFQVECVAQVVLPEGEAMAPRFSCRFRQADLQQMMSLGFYHPFVARQVYAELAEQLAGEGLVTTGSARHIAALPVNEGKRRRDWKDGKGFAWKHGHGWQLTECRLVRFDAQAKYIRLTTGTDTDDPF